MTIQSAFIKFNNNIKLDYECRSDLKNAKEVLVGKIRKIDDLPSFESLDQGSYSMHLGVIPVNGRQYDIDIALRFEADTVDYDPLEIKKIIRDKLANHTKIGAEIKMPCVTVTYTECGEASYHADIVVYVKNLFDNGDQLYIAKGKECCKKEKIKWEKADPSGLTNYVNNYFSNDDYRTQFRRIVRYLKRWKQLNFSASGHAEPPSIAITLMVCEGFTYYENNDLSALINVVEQIQKQFVLKNLFITEYWVIKKQLPSCLKVENENNIFEKMTCIQMTEFKRKIDCLLSSLESIKAESDGESQLKMLKKIFGDDFPIN